jgi:phosphohistidine swiveling domain-containing protein
MEQPFPTTLDELEKELLVHSKDCRDDALFRWVIFSAQCGNLAMHLSHDQELNPTSRPHGTPQSECSDFGHALLQLMTYGVLRGINIQGAVNTALQNLREKDFVKRVSESNNRVKGTVACSGFASGTAWVIPEGEPLVLPVNVNLKLIILVISHTVSDSRIAQFGGIVTDHGGMACHAAIIARECNIPCIVGTGNATKAIKTGDEIEINTMEYDGLVGRMPDE